MNTQKTIEQKCKCKECNHIASKTSEYCVSCQIKNHSPKTIEDDMTTGELNDIYNKNIWKALPFTKSFIERHCDTKENTETILSKIDEYHRHIISEQDRISRESEREKIINMFNGELAYELSKKLQTNKE